ncbi:MAG: fluoride efflux transporter CrcB [Endomicrobium sp.]|jgi:CrcB protein|nr:fluoride efflux transporter CrcB [Endomicrobium sp.]
MFLNAVAVFLGGDFGAMFRFLISETFPLNKFGMPLTIILVNFIGCFLMGLADGVFEKFAEHARHKYFLTAGLLGGFTTFSTFSLEFANLIKSGRLASGFLYVFVSVAAALIGFWLGYALSRAVKTY